MEFVFLCFLIFILLLLVFLDILFSFIIFRKDNLKDFVEEIMIDYVLNTDDFNIFNSLIKERSVYYEI